ncbi:MAG: hypothetical protein NT154_40175 [Verrucomicrobia bacterium]|nr:hypothetical protein [Verrucomicrobiota bacterium]
MPESAEQSTPAPNTYSSSGTHNTPQRPRGISDSDRHAQVTIDVSENYRTPSPFSRALQYAGGAKPTDLLHFCLSVVSCAVAFFLLYQSIALQRMLTHGKENAPDPDAGEGVSWLLFLLMCGIGCFYWVAGAQGRAGYSEPIEFFRQDWWAAALETPRGFAPVFLVGSVAPAAIALYKLAFALAWLHSRNVRARGLARFAQGGVIQQDSDSVLSRLDENMSTLKARIAVLETTLAMPTKGYQVVNKQPDRERRAEILYVTTLSAVFCVVTSGLIWVTTWVPLALVLTLVTWGIFVTILVAVLDLSKTGKLSERSLMEVLRSAFKFMSRRKK